MRVVDSTTKPDWNKSRREPQSVMTSTMATANHWVIYEAWRIVSSLLLHRLGVGWLCISWSIVRRFPRIPRNVPLTPSTVNTT